MTVETWTTYVAAVLVLMITPGPSQLLMLSNSVANGLRQARVRTLGEPERQIR